MTEAACKACAAGKVSKSGSRCCTDGSEKYIATNDGKTADVCTVMNDAADFMTTCCAIADCLAMVFVALDLLWCSDPGAAFLYEALPPAGLCALEVFCCTGEGFEAPFFGCQCFERLLGLWKRQNLC